MKFEMGWDGLLLDAMRENRSINLHKAFLTEDNMNSVFTQHGVPPDVDYVSMDIDSCDFQMFRTLLAKTEFRPKVVTVEYNAAYTCSESKVNVCMRGDERCAGQERMPKATQRTACGVVPEPCRKTFDTQGYQQEMDDHSRVAD